ncbi:MAG: hypothetical protein KBA26_13900 [Candidatus Delongbacteria bacterium]|nr:hypothetical protein [Candidatus Delongbacteria bacterium]
MKDRILWIVLMGLLFTITELPADPAGRPERRDSLGYYLFPARDSIRFIYHPEVYRQQVTGRERVFVAGSFNRWSEAKFNPDWIMKFDSLNQCFSLTVPWDSIVMTGASGYPEFKFVIYPSGWQSTHRFPAFYQQNGNLWINWDEGGDHTPPLLSQAYFEQPDRIGLVFNERVSSKSLKPKNFRLHPDRPIRNVRLDPDRRTLHLTIDSIRPQDYGYASPFVITCLDMADLKGNRSLKAQSMPMEFSRAMLDDYWKSLPMTSRSLGTETVENQVYFRLFGPRLKGAELFLYSKAQSRAPIRIQPMQKVEPAVWETALPCSLVVANPYYKFHILRQGTCHLISDLYTRANVYSAGKSIYLPDDPFPWQDQDFQTPDLTDLMIYESHVVNLTYGNPAVRPEYRGKFLALTETGPGTPLRHLIDLGINALEFYPSFEIGNGSSPHIQDNYDWGYMTALFFSPESDYGVDVASGGHRDEFRRMVDQLHRHGIAVIMDVVYNHTAVIDNYFQALDEMYFYTGTNFSGCGNDLDGHKAYVHRLIMDNLIYWIRDCHVDGFRFDMAQLLNQDSLFAPEAIATLNRAKPTRGPVLLMAENWAPDSLKPKISGIGVAQWNSDFRERVKSFLRRGEGNQNLIRSLNWTHDKPWCRVPGDAVNYLESHDEETLIHYLKEHLSDSVLIENRARLGAFLLAVAGGPLMLLEGQEQMRDKAKQFQDMESNLIDWDRMDRQIPMRDYMAGLFTLRREIPLLRFSHSVPPSQDSALGSSSPVGQKSVTDHTDQLMQSTSLRQSNVLRQSASLWVADTTLPEGVIMAELNDSITRLAILINISGRSFRFPIEPSQWRVLADSQRADTHQPRRMDRNDLIPGEFYLLRYEP